MAWFFVYCIPYQNLDDGKDNLAGRPPIKESDRCISAPAASCAPTPAVALVVAPLAASGSANSSVVIYSEDDL